MRHTIRHCPFCGSSSIIFTVPDGDNRPRHQCADCSRIQYFNPTPVVGVILEWEGKILLCQRSIEPRRGLWTYPAGFMELSETTRAGAARECLEEAGAECEDMRLFALFSLYREGQIHLTYRGRLRDGRCSPGEESLQTALVAPEDIDWQQLAFPVVVETLRLYVDDRARGRAEFHQGSIDLHPDGSWKTELESQA